MSSPKNIQRDGFYLNPEQATADWSTEFLVGGTPKFEGDASVNVDYASVWTVANATTTAGYLEGIGVYMQQPLGDRTPYRVQLKTQQLQGFLIIGHGPASPTGTDDLINHIWIAHQGYLDMLVMIEPSSTYSDRPLGFICAFQTAAALTAQSTPGALSVQNLAVKPPTMQNAVS